MGHGLLYQSGVPRGVGQVFEGRGAVGRLRGSTGTRQEVIAVLLVSFSAISLRGVIGIFTPNVTFTYSYIRNTARRTLPSFIVVTRRALNARLLFLFTSLQPLPVLILSPLLASFGRVILILSPFLKLGRLVSSTSQDAR
ncbi:hypothetical protein NITMOv2_3745 [Nitrospira moscoviensis]|uniref:Uncharacterized protein n=1 Tax=Nitrospira moscoviensis TaxID=42253 RepID=A0A0K2GGS1_NITMO|nr:hypothetical protein NITMOv2_3745 [Nitrospira moscoviensis]